MTARRHGSKSAGKLDAQLAALADVVRVGRGRLEDSRVDAATAVVEQARARLGLGMDATVVALAGSTGAGKSTLFNAMARAVLSRPGHLRPTTSSPTAAIWGDVGDSLLDWLDVRSRHRIDGAPHGLVLLDLPDFDSVQASNRAEADRIVAVADLTIWVVDPQKYADGVLHDRYLRPLAAHAGSMLVVLNQADRLDDAARAVCVDDLRRLLASDGLPGVPVLAVSGLSGLGLDALRVEAREAAAARLSADVRAAVGGLSSSCAGAPRSTSSADRNLLVAALGAASGAPSVVVAVAGARRRRGALATGWPYMRWLRRLRPDPLRRLRIEGRGGADRSSLAPPTRAQGAQVDAAIRSLAARVGGDLAEPWPGLLRSAALRECERMPAELERAVSGANLPVRVPAWWRAINLLQWLLVAASLLGGLWLLALAGLGYLQLDGVAPTPDVEGLPLPTLLLVGGLVLGLVLAMLTRAVNRFGARRRARTAERVLAARIGTVADAQVLGPLEAELDSRRELCVAIEQCSG